MPGSRPHDRGRGGDEGKRATFDYLNALVDRRWLRRLTKNQLAVYVAYLRHADGAGIAFPGNDLLADYLGHCDTGHVRRARSQLIKLGLLERVATGGKFGGDDTSRFRVNVPPWANSAHPGGGPNPPTPVGASGPGPCAHSAQKGGRNAPTEGTQGRSTVKGPINPTLAEHLIPAPRSAPDPLALDGVAPGQEPPPRRPASRTVPAEVPAALDTPEFLRAWADWQQHRREIRAALTPSTVGKQLAKMEKLGPAAAVASIEQSIEHGWRGLFEPKTLRSPANASHSQQKPADHPAARRGGEFPQQVRPLPRFSPSNAGRG